MVESWGRITRPRQSTATPRFIDDVAGVLRSRGSAPVLATGLHRSYGDSNLNSAGRLIDMTRLDRIISLDTEAGVLKAEAGLSIDEALQIIVPKGWFFRTTPGTRFVTLGGAIANDVHGKNHHRVGSFGNSVRSLTLVRSDGGSELDAGSGDLFQATVGGLGLTGVITSVEIELERIPSSFIEVQRMPFANVREFFQLSEMPAAHEHTVAWVDCTSGGRLLGRGILQRANWSASGGHHSHVRGTSLAVPTEMPGFLLNRHSVRVFNGVYHWLQKSGRQRTTVHYAPFFYPLDAIARWNRLYGPRGFYQYQCVIPPESAEQAVEEILKQVSGRGGGSFLAVLKTLGSIPSRGMLSFPREGTTLALDFPNRGAATLDLLSRLDRIVDEAGGRLYAAKDGRMPASMFRKGYPKLDRFLPHVDPAMTSDFWRRVTS
jgi:L-gulonolactone oxidase